MPPSSKWIAENSAAVALADVAKEAIRTRIAGVQHFLPRGAFLWEEDVEYVHDLRVATRRAAATLNLFQGLLPRKRFRPLSKTLKQIRKSADLARDLDVYIERIGQSQDEGATRLRRRLQKMRRKAQAPIVDVALPLLTDNLLARQVDSLLEKLRAPGDAPARFGDWSRLRLGEEWRNFAAQLPPTDPEPDQLHDFRIAGKRFRYALEVLSGGLPRQIREELYPRIEKLQGKLGTIQDHAVAAERLSTWQANTRNAEEKRLLADLEASERSQFADEAEAFRAWWHPEHVAQLRQIVDAVVESAT